MKKVLLGAGRFARKHWGVCIFIVVLLTFLYLLIGAVAPFIIYKKISDPNLGGWSAKAMLEAETSGDRAMILETNTSAWEERIRMMNMAKDRIILSSFDIRDGESTKDLMSVLLHKADEGVKVQILVDGISAFLRMEGRPLFYAVSSHPNIELRVYNPLKIWMPWKTQGRMHDKYVIVDEMAYILGGRNTFDYFIGDYETDGKSFDREMLIYKTGAQSSLHEVEDYFHSVWNLDICQTFHDDESLRDKQDVREMLALLENRYENLKTNYGYLFESFDYAAVTKPTKGVHLISGQTGIYGKEPLVFEKLSRLMLEADTQVIIHTPYAVCNDYMYDTLKKISSTVPEVRMLINSVGNGDNVVASSDYLKNKKHLINTGVEMYEYEGGTSYHGKSIVIDDDVAIVGSYNLDLRSTYMDTELMLLVKSEDIANELTGYMDAMEYDSRRVISATEYDTPAHVTPQEAPALKKIIFKILGVVLTPFRCLI